ncbi:bifunctional serine/threonine-protein kinase/formylglycine-generating enzyme family protein [Pajaroellobacter abortibovis]|uniref:Protein kinase domain-containing protein n=1 Tax=Pajaroellobacter abortibovis TaxID=1882918 RepID=A0A1L6MYP6_9BACT|nr:bifunctional serine/threonine-protein kinase/formylglycine-generating enzyme family protein [Pajaroellobacter abortibovis]APS00653.1 hypothetical protein BCY86_08190 [Pajaroellobacter abortibovis]
MVLQLNPGTIFGGDYRIVKPLSQGGMGFIYIAEQLSTGVLRALKLMQPQCVESTTMRRRFEQEARIGARIQSDYVVSVLGAGVDEASGVPWLAMELLQGEDLNQCVIRSPLAAEEAPQVFQPLFHAVAAAHDIGVIHRDLKPENIFLAKSRRPTEKFTLKVLDFGIAKLVEEGRTQATGTVGTPLWMAPEQASASERITPATDVWALGLIVFYALTGKRYWIEANKPNSTLPMLLRELVIKPLELATVRAQELGCTQLPPAHFDEWFSQCVARNPAERFPNAREAYMALAPIIGDRSGVTFSDPPTEIMKNDQYDIPQVITASRNRTLHLMDPLSSSDTELIPSFASSPHSDIRPNHPSLSNTTHSFSHSLSQLPPAAKKTEVGKTVYPSPSSTPVSHRSQKFSSTLAPSSRRLSPGRTLGLSLGSAILLLGIGWFFLFKKEAGPLSTTSPPILTPSVLNEEKNKEKAHLRYLADEETTAHLFEGTTFLMGSSKWDPLEAPPHHVTLQAFLLDISPVSVRNYNRCVAAGACSPAGQQKLCNASTENHENHPVNCVTWTQAQTYCEWIGRRLPIEEEWEYAAAGPNQATLPWRTSEIKGHVCSFMCAPDIPTCPLGAHPSGKTPEGIEDMLGNVLQWTASTFCPYDMLNCNSSLRTIRGTGGCPSDPNGWRNTIRRGKAPEHNDYTTGFRCAKTF